MKQTIIFCSLVALTAIGMAHSRSVPQGSRFDDDDDSIFDIFERDLDKRRTPLSQYVNWHASQPWDDLASGGSPDDLLGQYSFQSGLSNLVWTAEYDGYDLPFLFNITTDFGFCKQSIVTGTDIGEHTYVNGTVSKETTMRDAAFDLIPLINLSNYTDTQAQTDHLIVQAQASYDGHNQALLKLAGFCATAGQSTLTPGQSTDPPPDDTQKVQFVKDELRRKLLMYGGLDIEQGQDPPLTTTVATSTFTAAPMVETSVVPGVLPGPTRHGYNFYVAIGSPTSLVLGAATAFLNQLAWKQGNVHDVDWSAVTNTAAALLLGFILSAAILGRYLAFGAFNNAGATAATIARNPTDTIIRPVVRTTATGTRTATRRTLNTGRETLSGFALIANLRRTLRQQSEILDELQQNYVEHRLSGRPSSDPLGVNDLRQSGFSAPQLPFWTGNTAAGEGASTSAASNIPGSSNDQGVCELEQSAAALMAGLSFMQGPHTYSWSDQEEDGLADAPGLHPASPDEEVVREDEGRDPTGHCDN